MIRRWYGWLPAGVVGLVVAGSAVLAPGAAAEELPELSPADVLTLLTSRDAVPFSAEFSQTSDLGLPSLPTDVPGADAAPAMEVLDLLTGDHTGRVFVGEDHRARLQLFDGFDERDLITDGSQAWLYDSGDESVAHLTSSGGEHTPATAAPTPEDLADQIVAAAAPETELSVRQDVSVAGRAAYDLVFTPSTPGTLVGEASIAVDGQTGIPLRVTVTARGAAHPALEATYTSFAAAAPDPDLFSFTPPAGATVTEVDPPTGAHPTADPADLPRVIGHGWDAIAEIPAGTLDPAALPAELTTAVEGGRALTTSLATVLITDDGRVLVGAVPLERLQDAT